MNSISPLAAARETGARALRVLHVVPALAPRYGGPSRVAIEMVGALRALGVEALVASTDADGPGRLPVTGGRITHHRGVPAIFFRRQWGEAIKYSRPLARWLAAEAPGFDVIHVHAVFSHASLAAGRAARRARIPYVVRPLGTLDPWSLRQKPLRKRLAWRLGVGALLRGAAAVHYTAEAERTGAEATLGIGRGVVIPLGVDDTLLDARPGAGPLGEVATDPAPYVLALGRLHPKKGLETLLPAFLFATRSPELARWRLVVAGDGAPGYAARLRGLATELGGDGRVVFTGWLEGTRRRDAIVGAALLVQASQQENFALSVVEAMAAGVPVMVSPHVNLAGSIRQAGAGWVLEPGTEALAATLPAILADGQERRSRGEAGRQLVRTHYTWPAVAGQLLALYRQLVETNAVARVA